jgi:cyclophilin family peptidyl-prolyl cis-trans isomerase
MGRVRAAAAVLALLPSLVSAQDATPPAAAPDMVVETDAGRFVIRLRPDLAPAHVAHFLKTAQAGGYDHTTFHRIIAGGIIQGGDPLSKDPARAKLYGTGGLGLLKAEFSEGAFARGVVAAARKPSGLNTGGSQFFVVLREQPALKGQYSIFGEVVEGMDVVDKISLTPVEGDRPLSRVEIRSVTPRPLPGP